MHPHLTLAWVLCFIWSMDDPPSTHIHTLIHTMLCVLPWHSYRHSVCLIFSLAPLPSWEHSWHPEAQRGSNTGLKGVSHSKAGTLSCNQLTIPPFPPFGPQQPAYPPLLRGGSLRVEWPLWRMVWFLWEEILLAQFPSATSTSGALPEPGSKNVNWQRT